MATPRTRTPGERAADVQAAAEAEEKVRKAEADARVAAAEAMAIADAAKRAEEEQQDARRDAFEEEEKRKEEEAFEKYRKEKQARLEAALTSGAPPFPPSPRPRQTVVGVQDVTVLALKDAPNIHMGKRRYVLKKGAETVMDHSHAEALRQTGWVAVLGNK